MTMGWDETGIDLSVLKDAEIYIYKSRGRREMVTRDECIEIATKVATDMAMSPEATGELVERSLAEHARLRLVGTIEFEPCPKCGRRDGKGHVICPPSHWVIRLHDGSYLVRHWLLPEPRGPLGGPVEIFHAEDSARKEADAIGGTVVAVRVELA